MTGTRMAPYSRSRSGPEGAFVFRFPDMPERAEPEESDRPDIGTGRFSRDEEERSRGSTRWRVTRSSVRGIRGMTCKNQIEGN